MQSKEPPKAASVGRQTQPGVQPAADKDPGNPFDLSSYFAQELETSGRMKPVVWSMGDPVFRRASVDRKVEYKDDFPALATAQAAATRLGLDYVAVVSGRLKEGMLHGAVTLYRGSRKVWEKEDSVGAVVSGTFDVEGSVTSICRTWSQLLGESVLKGQPVAPVHPVPDESPGQVVATPPVEPPRPVVDNRALLVEAGELMRQGKMSEAVGLLRDAVDTAPMDVERRTVFATLLLRAGQPEMAAQEARRASALLPDSVALRAMAARAWLAAGQPDEAQEDLKQAIARNPEDPETRSLLAEIALKEGKPSAAAEHLQHALQRGATPLLRFQMAVAQTGLGNLETVQTELREAGTPKDEVELRGRYEFAIPLLDGWAKTESGNLVSLFQRALVRRTDPAVAEQVVRNKKQLDAFVALAQALPVPAPHQSSHDRRLVALRLMVQCVGDLAAYLGSGNEDLISEGRISLGEAIRSLNSAIESYRKERTGEG